MYFMSLLSVMGICSFVFLVGKIERIPE
jgi:hypothetical protein